MSFVAIANPPPTTAEPPITQDGWWPDIDPAQARQACLLDGTTTAPRLRQALQAAILSINSELHTWAQQHQRSGHASLADIPAPQIDGQSAHLPHYHRAIYACLQADLLDAYRGMAAVSTGNKIDRSNEDLQKNAAEHRRNQRWAISALLGRSRATIDLL